MRLAAGWVLLGALGGCRPALGDGARGADLEVADAAKVEVVETRDEPPIEARSSADADEASHAARDAPVSARPEPPLPTGEDGELVRAAQEALAKGDREGARTRYLELIQRFPGSRHVPEAYVGLADSYFDEGAHDQARALFEKVLTFPDAPVAHYARYKLAWTHFNLGAHSEALVALVRVVESETALTSLRREALKDLPLFYAEVGAPEKARAAFTRWVGDPKVVELLVQALAEVYEDQGKIADRERLRTSR